MKHCIYTNYLNAVKSGYYAAYHFNSNGEEATLGLRFQNGKWCMDQFRGIGNSTPSAVLQENLKTFSETNDIKELCFI
jgi:hypothetical protein